MQVKENLKEIQPQNIAKLLEKHYFSLMASFYETQSLFLSGVYKRYGGIKTANIILCYARSTHLEIIRQRENNLQNMHVRGKSGAYPSRQEGQLTVFLGPLAGWKPAA